MCHPCPLGSWSSAGSGICTECAAGQTTLAQRSDSKEKCVSTRVVAKTTSHRLLFTAKAQLTCTEVSIELYVRPLCSRFIYLHRHRHTVTKTHARVRAHARTDTSTRLNWSCFCTPLSLLFSHYTPHLPPFCVFFSSEP